MNAKPIAWMLVTATGVTTSMGLVVPEPALAAASVMFGASALATSMLARRSVSKYRRMGRIEKRLAAA